jgi:penicillin amidase
LSAGALIAGLLVVAPAPAGHAEAVDTVKIPGLRAAASVIRDVDGIPHLRATNAHDLFFRQGWVHADDRLFQMDVTRRRGSGTLAERPRPVGGRWTRWPGASAGTSAASSSKTCCAGG